MHASTGERLISLSVLLRLDNTEVRRLDSDGKRPSLLKKVLRYCRASIHLNFSVNDPSSESVIGFGAYTDPRDHTKQAVLHRQSLVGIHQQSIISR